MKHIKAAEKGWEEGLGYSKRKLLSTSPLPGTVDLVQEVRFSRGSTIPPHYHRVQTEVFYALAPGSITINDAKIEMATGDMVVCEPGEVHGMPLVEENFGFLVLKIDYRTDDTVWL